MLFCNEPEHSSDGCEEDFEKDVLVNPISKFKKFEKVENSIFVERERERERERWRRRKVVFVMSLSIQVIVRRTFEGRACESKKTKGRRIDPMRR